MAETTPNAKTTMLLHSEAKVEFLKNYLQRYLRILYRASNISEINIFDVFCGTGIYDNGKKGSPIIAFEAIKAIYDQYGGQKTINLYVNDGAAAKIEGVKKLIEDQNVGFCTTHYFNLPAEEMFAQVSKELARQSRNVRNLIFIDPYGYKEIRKKTLEDLLGNHRTEIILFLPISQMRRFTQTAVASDLKPYEPLREFVHSFFPKDHPIVEQTLSSFEYVDAVKEALKFGQYFSTSYYIERDEGNYYALFFVSPHIYGFEKILEVKWQLDDESGRGFRQPDAPTLFDHESKELQKVSNYERLAQLLEGFLASSKTNREVYEFVLRNEFLPTHAADVFRDWQKSRSEFSVLDAVTNKPARKGGFYVKWYGPGKGNSPKVLISLNK